VQLAREGRVEKTWGGIRAIPNSSVPVGPPAFAKRLAENTAEKRAIAEAAARLLSDGDVVMIDGGTTTYQLCEFIAHKRIRIITNSLVIAQAVDRLKGRERGAEIYLTGGILEPESSVLAGPPAEAFLARYHAHWAFVSAAGVDGRVVVMADHTKLGRRAMCVLCSLGKVDHLFTGELKESEQALRGAVWPKLAVHRVRVPTMQAA
jgi:DeoR/GlpR family transcriptional regulator of sugar metabolism